MEYSTGINNGICIYWSIINKRMVFVDLYIRSDVQVYGYTSIIVMYRKALIVVYQIGSMVIGMWSICLQLEYH